jgi:signal transduction histidine kinase
MNISIRDISLVAKKTALIAAIIFCNCNRTNNHPVSALDNKTIIKDTARINQYFKKANEDSTMAEKLSLLRRAMKESIAIGYNDGVVGAVFSITALFFEHGQFDSCTGYYDLAYRYAAHPSFRKDLLPSLYMNHGTFNYLKGNYVTADSLYYAGLQSTKNEKEFENIKFLLLYNLHFTKNLIGQKELALSYIIEAEKQARAVNDSSRLTLALIAKTESYITEHKYDSAQLSLNKSILTNKGDTMPEQLNLAAQIISYGDSCEKAIPIIKKAINIAIKRQIDFDRMSLYSLLAGIYVRLKEYDQAIETIEPIIKEGVQKGFGSQLTWAYNSLEMAYEKKGEYEKSLEIAKKMHILQDSLLNIEKIKSLDELEVKYKTVEKDKMIAVNNLEMSQQKNKIARQNILIISISAFVILLVAGFSSYMKIKKQQIVHLKQQKEIDNLKSKMEGEENERERLARDLHDDIGGLLSGVMMQTEKLEEENPLIKQSANFRAIKKAIKETATNVRKTASNLIPDPVVKLGLSEAILQFCSSIIRNSSPAVDVLTYGELNDLDLALRLAIYRMVQELLHNAIKHSNASNLLVQVATDKNIVGIAVEDDGIGMDTQLPRTGMGLNNIKHRVNNLNGKMSVSSSPGKGTAINIELPVKQFSQNGK